ncbi:glycosyl hydrolase family 61-domain-containing protein [Geopyxis carbonaria]|nr:glycosyl hydrolase family 61-domain-containing protein [Geopyxis carbonaria]
MFPHAALFYPGFSPYLDLPPSNTTNATAALPPRISYTLSSNWPVTAVASPNLTCSHNPIPGAAALVAPARPGAVMELLYTPWPNNHFGPILTYMASCHGSCANYTAYEAQWFKIAQDGLRADGSWASDEFIAANSTWRVEVPKDLPAGEYLVRNELVSLHAVEQYGAEIYPACFQIAIVGEAAAREGGAEGVLPVGVRIPGPEFYKVDEPGLMYNVTTDAGKPYVFPGPPVYNDQEGLARRKRSIRQRRGRKRSGSGV